MSDKSFRIPEGKFCPYQSIPSGNGLKVTASPTYHSLREQVGDTVIFEKGFTELGVQKYNHNKLYNKENSKKFSIFSQTTFFLTQN